MRRLDNQLTMIYAPFKVRAFVPLNDIVPLQNVAGIGVCFDLRTRLLQDLDSRHAFRL